MKKVMVFGTFDHLHAGHENLIKQAREYGDFIIAVVSRDETVKKIKQNASDNNAKKRAQNLKEKNWADRVIIGEKNDQYKVIKKHKPNIIALGYDQFVFTQKLPKIIIENKLNTEIVRLKPYHPNIYKSSIIKKTKCVIIKAKELF